MGPADVRRPAAPRRSNTLAQLMASGLPVSAWCEACGRSVDLHLPTLAERYGGETPIFDLIPKFRCVFCGGPGTIRIGSPRR